MALCEDDIDPALIADTRAVVATGTHLSHPRTEAAVLKALSLARENGARTALDIDYRPNLWGLAGHEAGEERFIESAEVTAKLQSTLHLFDLIVGTEEEFHIAGGSTDTIAALRAVRAVSDATLVCKRGPHGRRRLHRRHPRQPRRGRARPGLPDRGLQRARRRRRLHVGALKGWLTDQDWPTSLKYANACGAFAVSPPRLHPRLPVVGGAQLLPRARHQGEGAAPRRRARAAALVDQPAAATGRRCGSSPSTTACSSRRSPTSSGSRTSASAPSSSSASRRRSQVAAGRPGYGILCDGRLGRDALYAAAGSGLWIGRPVEDPGTRPLRLEIEPDYGSALAEWPLEHVVKVLCLLPPRRRRPR